MSERDISIDPQPGDVAEVRERPDRTVTLRFTDATGQECIWYTETRCIPVKSWTRWYKRSGAFESPNKWGTRA